jgi:hypothetical protein
MSKAFVAVPKGSHDHVPWVQAALEARQSPNLRHAVGITTRHRTTYADRTPALDAGRPLAGARGANAGLLARGGA